MGRPKLHIQKSFTMSSFHITVIQVGKTKTSYIQEAENEYKKRLQPYISLKVITMKDGQAPKNSSEAEKEQVKKEEGERILQAAPSSAFLIALDERGKQFTSPQFAELLGKHIDQGTPGITVVIGGCYGLSEEVRQRADLILAFSKFTFTHEMIRPLLYEQLYRSFALIKGKKYHY